MLIAPISLLLLYLSEEAELFYRNKNVNHFNFGKFNTFSLSLINIILLRIIPRFGAFGKWN